MNSAVLVPARCVRVNPHSSTARALASVYEGGHVVRDAVNKAERGACGCLRVRTSCGPEGRLFAFTMFLLEPDTLFCTSSLLEAGSAVNGGEDASGQSPAHVAACGGEAFCLLWLLQTGADPNQQDAFGETPVHKAARAGSLECISVLVASDAQLEICNHERLTAEDVAWSAGHEHCGRLLRTLRNNGQALASTAPGRKRAREHTSLDAVDGKKAKDW